MNDVAKCPVAHKPRPTMGNARWWPDQLNLSMLHQHSELSDPMAADFDYAAEFAKLDLDAVIRDLHALMTDSQDWWPADYGHYGPFFIRMGVALAPAPTASADGRGGAGSGDAAFRAAQQLAGQRQPGQGTPPAVADQAEVRAQAFVGRPDDPDRQRGAGFDGLQDLRLRWWPRARRVGTRRRSTGAPKPTWMGDKRYTGDRDLARIRWGPCRWA